MWFKSLVSYVLKLLIALTPLVVVPLVVAEETNHPTLAWLLGATKENVQQRAVAFFTVLDILTLATYETFTNFLPQRQARRVADVYVAGLLDGFRNVITGARPEARSRHPHQHHVRPPIGVHALHSAVRLIRNRGFEGAHQDNGLWLFVGQGICGRAFKERKTLVADLRGSDSEHPPWWPCRDNFYLFPWQRRKTAHLTAILTIPIFAEEHLGLMTSHRPVGVIIHAVSENGAERLLSNKKRLDEFFKESGKVLALLAPR